MSFRRPLALFLLAACAASTAHPAGAQVAFQPRWHEPLPGVAGIEDRVLELIQQIRRRSGLPPLEVDPALQRAGRQHSREMFDRGYLSHESPRREWRTPLARAYLSGFLDPYVGENVGHVYRSQGASEEDYAQEFVSGWMNSAPHRRNILHPEYTHAGVGVWGNRRHYYATQVFGGPAFEFRRVRLSEEKAILYRWQVTYRTGARQLGLWVNGEFVKETRVEDGRATLTWDLPDGTGSYRLQVGADQVVTGEWVIDTSQRVREPFRRVSDGRLAELVADRSEKITLPVYCLRGEARPLVRVDRARLRVGDETRARYPARQGRFFSFEVCLPRDGALHRVGLFPDTVVKYQFFIHTGKPLAEAFQPRPVEP